MTLPVDAVQFAANAAFKQLDSLNYSGAHQECAGVAD
jgi:hypothetical protein